MNLTSEQVKHIRKSKEYVVRYSKNPESAQIELDNGFAVATLPVKFNMCNYGPVVNDITVVQLYVSQDRVFQTFANLLRVGDELEVGFVLDAYGAPDNTVTLAGLRVDELQFIIKRGKKEYTLSMHTGVSKRDSAIGGSLTF